MAVSVLNSIARRAHIKKLGGKPSEDATCVRRHKNGGEAPRSAQEGCYEHPGDAEIATWRDPEEFRRL